jgi:hypothetical protein
MSKEMAIDDEGSEVESVDRRRLQAWNEYFDDEDLTATQPNIRIWIQRMEYIFA